MASPVVQTAAGAIGDSATPTITEPASATTGDLLVAVVASGDATTAITGLTGWTQMAEGDDTQGNRFWYGWIIRGASAPDLVAAAASARWSTSCVRIDGHDATTPIGSDHGNANGTGTAPDPPNVDPGSSRDHLSIAAAVQEGKGATRYSPPTTPGTYTEHTDAGSSGSGAGTGHTSTTLASRAYTGQAENPGTFTSTVSDGWLAATIIVRPTAGTDYTETPNEAVGITDATPIKQGKVRAEAVGITDATSRILTDVRSKTEAVGITDSVTTAMTKVRTEDQYLATDGAGGFAETPDHASLDIVGDFSLRWDGYLADVTPVEDERLVFKWTGTERSYGVAINTTGLINVSWSTNGTDQPVLSSSVAIPYAAFERFQIKVDFDVDAGSTDKEATYYTRKPGQQWVQLGTVQNQAGIATVHSGTSPLFVAASDGGGFGEIEGRTYSAQVYDGIDGTLVADFNAGDFNAGDIASDTANDSVGKTWTIQGAASIVGPIVRVTDTVLAAITKQRSFTEPVGITDTVLPAKTIRVTINESVGVTDTTTRVVPAVRTVTEPVGITDATPIKQGKLITEPVGIVDDNLSKLTIAQTITEAVGITDATTEAVTAARTVTEPVGVTDATPIKQSKVITEAVGVTDATPHIQGGDKFETVTEAVGVTDTTARQIDAVRSVTEAVGVTDTVLPAKTIRVTINEAVGITDGVAPAKASTVVITEAVGVTDDTPEVLDAVRVVTEPVGVTDAAAPAKMAVRTITENVGVTDATSVGGVGINYQVTINEAIGITDSVATSAAPWWTKTPVGATKTPVGIDKRTGDEESPG